MWRLRSQGSQEGRSPGPNELRIFLQGKGWKLDRHEVGGLGQTGVTTGVLSSPHAPIFSLTLLNMEEGLEALTGGSGATAWSKEQAPEQLDERAQPWSTVKNTHGVWWPAAPSAVSKSRGCSPNLSWGGEPAYQRQQQQQ